MPGNSIRRCNQKINHYPTSATLGDNGTTLSRFNPSASVTFESVTRDNFHSSLSSPPHSGFPIISALAEGSTPIPLVLRRTNTQETSSINQQVSENTISSLTCMRRVRSNTLDPSDIIEELVKCEHCRGHFPVAVIDRHRVQCIIGLTRQPSRQSSRQSSRQPIEYSHSFDQTLSINQSTTVSETPSMGILESLLRPSSTTSQQSNNQNNETPTIPNLEPEESPYICEICHVSMAISERSDHEMAHDLQLRDQRGLLADHALGSIGVFENLVNACDRLSPAQISGDLIEFSVNVETRRRPAYIETYHLTNFLNSDEGTPTYVVCSLPISKYTGCDEDKPTQEVDQTCPVCLEKYNLDDEIRRLPCLHFFHVNCIDVWLKRSTLCPFCKRSVYQTPETSRRAAERRQSIRRLSPLGYF